ncbi:MAG: gliding motility-associated-like protein, partial [Planctomycetota bacterium]
NGCDSVITITVTELGMLTGILDTSICTGTSFTYNGTIYGNGNFSGTEILLSSIGCDSSVAVSVTEFAIPIVGAIANPNDTVCARDQIMLIGTNANSYVWDNGVIDNVAFVAVAGSATYNVIGTDLNGCVASYSISIFAFTDYNFTLNPTICSDEQHTLPDGSLVNTAGVYNTNFLSVNGCDSTYVTSLNVTQAGSFSELDDIATCSGLAETLTISAQNMTSFEWFVNDGSGAQSLIGDADYIGAVTNSLSFNLDLSLHNNIYSVAMIDECGRLYFSDMNLEVFAPHAVVNGVEDILFCEHEIAAIIVDYNGHDYIWNNGSTGASIIPTQGGTYIVNFVENVTNCLLSDTIEIGIEDCIGNCVVLAPTGFSPDKNGTNDVFRIVTSCEEEFVTFSFTVFDRWGQLTYQTDDWREGWDGTYRGRKAEIGVYTYYVEYTKFLSNKKESIAGNVTLVR